MAASRGLAGALAVLCLLAATVSLPSDAQARSSNANTAALQVALKALRHYTGGIDGIAGRRTKRAVRRFQRSHRLPADGVAGPRTRRKLGRRGRPLLGRRIMRRGNHGWDVAALQFMLQRRGYSPGGIDGGFGAGTYSALTSFQRAAGLTVDGLAGDATISALRHRSNTTTRTPTGPVRFFQPVSGPIGDRFGAPREGGRKHSGIDYPVAHGTLVEAAGVGTTVFAGANTGGYGNLVVIQHRLGYTTWYAHLSRITTWVGERVEGGTRIGYVGSTGNSTGPHLHFEVRLNNVPLDPIPYMLAGTAARAASAPGASCTDPDAYKTATIDDCR
jgi:peptidoglycan hydrolase-like protein with peptidoglycan-binding domain